MSKKKQIDWESVAKHYRAGVRSLRDIASEFDITEGAIRKKAKAEEWPRDLSERMKARAVLKTEGDDPKDKSGFVYVIYLDDSANERFFKIGMSENFNSRFQNHQCASPFDICVAMAFFVSNMRKTETYLHNKFKEKHVKGEWFNLNDKDLSQIAELSKII